MENIIYIIILTLAFISWYCIVHAYFSNKEKSLYKEIADEAITKTIHRSCEIYSTKGALVEKLNALKCNALNPKAPRKLKLQVIEEMEIIIKKL